jgi:hypothetical protein
MKTILTWPCLLLAGLFFAPSCGGEAGAGGGGAANATTATSALKEGETKTGEMKKVENGVAAPRAPLADWQRNLLQIAYDAASGFPLVPHKKNRGRAQEVVVAACFELDQPELAKRFGDGIVDWRRGVALADYAWYQAKHGVRTGLEPVLAAAAKVVDEERNDPNAQQWRSDLVALKIARAWAALGDAERAAKASRGIDPASANAVDEQWASAVAERADLIPADQAGAELAKLDATFADMSLGQQASAGALLVRLHERCFADAALRAELEKRPVVLWHKLSPQIRLDLVARLLRTNLKHGEKARAAELLAVVREGVAAHQWRAEDELPWRARLCELAFAAGDTERAKADAVLALARYHELREGIVNIYRAKTLRPLMLAQFRLGDRTGAADLLALVLEEGMENPNSRPRCDDLVDTCVALVVAGCEPSAQALARIREIARGLGEPW